MSSLTPSSVSSGMASSTQARAFSRKMPSGLPVSSRSMTPPSTSSACSLMPMIFRAAVLQTITWPQVRVKARGTVVEILSRSSRVMKRCSSEKLSWFQPRPRTQRPSGMSWVARNSREYSIRPSIDVQALWFMSRRMSPSDRLCICVSKKPGRMVLPFMSSASQAPTLAKTSSLVPTALKQPSSTSMASACMASFSMVTMFAL